MRVVLPIILMFSQLMASDLDRILEKWRPVKMPFNKEAYSPSEQQLIAKLVEASQHLEEIYWRQSDPEALHLYKTTENHKLRRLLRIYGSRFDLLDGDRPFVGTEPMPKGRGFYPKGLTRQAVEEYVKEHPAKKAEIYNPYTIVRWRDGQLVGIPYYKEFSQFLNPAAQALREAASLSADKNFARFLRARADALLNDDYYPSDLLWLDLKDPKFDVIMAPYETYLDSLLGVKTSYGAAVLIRNETESRQLAVYQKYIPALQDALPLPPEDLPSKRGHLTPMEVMDAPFRSGDLLHGYQAVADNLPNDPRIHKEKGTKKIFFKNFMDARVNYIILPLAKKLMLPDQAAQVSGEGYLAAVVLHEISHGLGPVYARTKGGQVDIREAIGPLYSGLEEAKADVVGMYGLKWLVDKGVLPQKRLEEYYASYVAGIFRTVRFGTAEAHGRAEMMEFNFLAGQKAIARDGAYYRIDYQHMPAAVAALAKELLEIEATGDRGRAERWFAKHERMPQTLRAMLDDITDVPVDIEPEFSFPIMRDN
jgi:hypothetical protein